MHVSPLATAWAVLDTAWAFGRFSWDQLLEIPARSDRIIRSVAPIRNSVVALIALMASMADPKNNGAEPVTLPARCKTVIYVDGHWLESHVNSPAIPAGHQPQMES